MKKTTRRLITILISILAVFILIGTTLENVDSTIKSIQKIYLYYGFYYLEKGDLEKSENFFIKSINLNENDYNPYLGLETIYRKIEKLKEAEFLLNKAIELNNKNENLYIELGEIYEKQREVRRS